MSATRPSWLGIPLGQVPPEFRMDALDEGEMPEKLNQAWRDLNEARAEIARLRLEIDDLKKARG